MRKLADFSAVIFDMDGLVLDTETGYIMAWQQAAHAMGLDLPEQVCRSLSGLHYAELEQKLISLYGTDFNLKAFNHTAGRFWREHVNAEGIKVKHGFKELLDVITRQKIPFCLATNSRAVNAYECLELAGLNDVFSIIITRDHVQHGKPEPEIFLTAAELLQVEINRCMVIEDSHAGIVAASRAGAFSVFIPSMHPVNPLAIDLCNLMMADLAQLADAMCA
ncbi:MAG: HAD family phosphatase [Methylobacter sp.]|nr:HAD family phosphatase [Methylobacter sp.]